MTLWQTTIDAMNLLVSFDHELWKIVAVSFSVSLSAISLVIIPAIIMAFILAYTE